eukprot:jgi/Chlat1/4130/Chrsp269S03959
MLLQTPQTSIPIAATTPQHAEQARCKGAAAGRSSCWSLPGSIKPACAHCGQVTPESRPASSVEHGRGECNRGGIGSSGGHMHDASFRFVANTTGPDQSRRSLQTGDCTMTPSTCYCQVLHHRMLLHGSWLTQCGSTRACPSM